ncbi:MAG: asparagine synthase (glutamine-hydrolyzing) [Acidimicrobiales bacterium]
MCGIVGFTGRDPELLDAMLASIEHRGPDSWGAEVGEEFTVGMRRLSIIDIEGGEQPICSERTGSCIVFNGELYNNTELRRELVRAGHSFVSDHSDTETVLRAYEQWGASCVTHLTGMFAFAIVDRRSHQLFLARDRLGIKPLYYHAAAGRFCFASELKALFQDPRVPRAADMGVLYQFLLHRVHDAGEETFFQGVKRLLPGHFMTVSADGRTDVRKYWEPEVNPEFSSSRPDAYYAAAFAELFERVIGRHMIADVPVGVSLSGGLDSSGVSSVMASLMGAGADTHTEGSLHTFSALYPGQSIDESQYVHSVERYVKSVPHYAYPTVDAFWDEITEWVWYQEEPTISSAPYAYYSVYRIAKGEVKVILSGNGGDELLAGYVPYFRTYLSSAMDQHHFLAAVREVVLGRDLYSKFARELLQRRRPGRSRQFSMPDLLTAEPSELAAFDYRPSRNLNVRLADDVLRYSTPNLLRYEDKNSMAFSIESRVPFLDHELVEFIFQLPIDQKIKMGWNRYVYRQAMKAKMPELNRTRRSKIGFTNPETAWTRERAPQIKEIFSSSALCSRGIFDSGHLIEEFDAWLAGKPGDGLAFWRVLVTELWLRRYVDSPVSVR